MKVGCDNGGGGQDATFHVVVTPGLGALCIKSVPITPSVGTKTNLAKETRYSE
jgi:hypothetical protein